MKEHRNETLMKLYNTDVVGSYRFKLQNLGYIYISKLLLTRSERTYLIDIARQGRNNLALTSSREIGLCIKKSFYNAFVLKNSIYQGNLDIKIMSDDPEFISKLARFLARNENVDYVISVSAVTGQEHLNQNHIEFLSSPISMIAFSTRSINCLASLNIQYVYQIIEYGKQLLKVVNFGETTLDNIKGVFKNAKLNFNCVPKDLIAIARNRCEAKKMIV